MSALISLRPRLNSGWLSRFGVRGLLAKQALVAALKSRRRLKIDLHEATCAFDAAERLGVEVRFVPIASLEGMYIRGSENGMTPRMLVASDRPAGRQAMTAGHELGHHIFSHGTRIDQYLNKSALTRLQEERFNEGVDSEEYLAQTFGSYFLMPKSAVDRGFATRGYDLARATPEQAYAVAGWLGVGYSSLIHHMWWSLNLINSRQAELLLATRLPRLREQIFGRALASDLYIVDRNWTGRPVDMKIGDVALVPYGTVVEASTGALADRPKTPPVITYTTASGLQVVEATAAGLGRIVGSDWAAFVRVSRRAFVGLNQYRHLPDDPNEDGEPDDGPWSASDTAANAEMHE